MRTIAFVGQSGTGKSHRASAVARQNGADAIIDDGLLISGGRVVAGTSAKKAPTKLASVRQALFIDKNSAKEVSEAIKKLNPQCVMILGTSDGMVEKIAEALLLPQIEKIIRIEDVATAEEIATAQRVRNVEGKHIIPVPAFEIKQDFSGYFLHQLRIFQKSIIPNDDDYTEDKTIVRPTFSYLGNFTISDNVIKSAVCHEALKDNAVKKVSVMDIRSTSHGAHIDVSVVLKYGVNIQESCRKIQERIRKGIERNTSINVRRVHIYVKSLHFDK
ncbi:MAG: Asp23/Gls24 family envelope stress response protein [Clostridia bacterium]|nr:Asp23/Gls24 family envelope stress response protein [Clostridia bacterium]MBQ8637392.1 Asp23/Gls24 family envelope stress response protein [Clostridia bacterium]